MNYFELWFYSKLNNLTGHKRYIALAWKFMETIFPKILFVCNTTAELLLSLWNRDLCPIFYRKCLTFISYEKFFYDKMDLRLFIFMWRYPQNCQTQVKTRAFNYFVETRGYRLKFTKFIRHNSWFINKWHQINLRKLHKNLFVYFTQ